MMRLFADPSLLLVEEDDDLREVLLELLTEEGYTVEAVASWKAALAHIDEQIFSLILADVSARRPSQRLETVYWLCRCAYPTPVGLMTTQNLDAEEVKRQGFAFLLHKPFDLEVLLSLLASTISHAPTAEQQYQEQVVQRYFTALEAGDWAALEQLCTPDVTYYPSVQVPFAPAKKICGLDAYRSYAKAFCRQLPGFAFGEVLLRPQPKGLAARYRSSWMGAGGTLQHLAGTALFHFQGERIRQVGVWLNARRLQAFLSSESLVN